MKRSLVVVATLLGLAMVLVFAGTVKAESTSQVTMPPDSVTVDPVVVLPGEVMELTLGKDTVTAVAHGARGLKAYDANISKYTESAMYSDGKDFEVAVEMSIGQPYSVTMPADVVFQNNGSVTLTFTVLVQKPASTALVTATVKSFNTEKIPLTKNVEVQRGAFQKSDKLTFTPAAPQKTTLFSSLPFTTSVTGSTVPYGSKYNVVDITGAASETVVDAEGLVYLSIVSSKDGSIILATPAKATTATSAAPAAKPGSSTTPPGVSAPSSSTPPGATSALPKSGDGDRDLNPVQAFFAWIGRLFSSR